MKVPSFITRAHPVWILVLTVVIESFACFMRFGLGVESTADTAWCAPFTFGLRIHHGHVGVLVVIIALVSFRRTLWRIWAVYIGLALIVSDLLHHFVVLWIITGSPQFDLVYP